MHRRPFLFGVAASALGPGLVACSAKSAMIAPAQPAAGRAEVGAFNATLNAAARNYPDQKTLAAVRAAVASPATPAAKIDTALAVLGGYAYLPNVLQPIPPNTPLAFPADHRLHYDTTVEWYYTTLSLPLTNGGLVSVVCTWFRKSLASSANALGPDLARQVFDTSIGVTLQMPGSAATHYAWPVQNFFGTDPAVRVQGSPFLLAVGAQSISGTADVFPAKIHLEDAGDASVARPPITIDVQCAASNPLFLQGVNGYVGNARAATSSGDVGYYYYSWPQQATSGVVTIAGTTYSVSGGLAWLDHQYGGAAPLTSGPASVWSGWSWFEFEFEGNRSITNFNNHGPIVGGIDNPLPGFGTYVGDGITELIGVQLQIQGYTPSPSTTASYPSAWMLAVGQVSGSLPLALQITPAAAVKQQALWMGGSIEYAEAAVAVTAVGTIGNTPVSLSGVGYCESVGFEDPALTLARQLAFLAT